MLGSGGFSSGKKTKLSNLFGNDDSDSMNESLGFKAKSREEIMNPGLAEAKKREEEQRDKKFAAAGQVNVFAYPGGACKPMGPQGMAIVSAKQGDVERWVIFIYTAQNQPICQIMVTESFEFKVLENNYCGFYDLQGQYWTVSSDQPTQYQFAQAIGMAKMDRTKLGSNHALMVQNLNPEPSGQALSAENKCIVKLDVYLPSPYHPKGLGQKVYSEASLKLKLSSGKPIAGVCEGCVGMKIGSQRLLVVPPGKAWGASGNPKLQIPANSSIVVVITVLKAKFNSSKAKTAVPAITAPAPAVAAPAVAQPVVVATQQQTFAIAAPAVQSRQTRTTSLSKVARMAEAAGVQRMILPGMKTMGDSAQPMAVAAADSQALVLVEQPQTSPNNGGDYDDFEPADQRAEVPQTQAIQVAQTQQVAPQQQQQPMTQQQNQQHQQMMQVAQTQQQQQQPMMQQQQQQPMMQQMNQQSMPMQQNQPMPQNQPMQMNQPRNQNQQMQMNQHRQQMNTQPISPAIMSPMQNQQYPQRGGYQDYGGGVVYDQNDGGHSRYRDERRPRYDRRQPSRSPYSVHSRRDYDRDFDTGSRMGGYGSEYSSSTHLLDLTRKVDQMHAKMNEPVLGADVSGIQFMKTFQTFYKEYETNKSNVESLTEQVESLRSKNRALHEKNHTLIEKNSELMEAKFSLLSNADAKFNDQISKLTQEKDQAVFKMNESVSALGEWSAELASVRAELESTRSRLAESEQRAQSALGELEALKTDARSGDEMRAGLMSDLEAANQESTDLKTRVSEISSELAERTSANAELTKKINEVNEEMVRLKKFEETQNSQAEELASMRSDVAKSRSALAEQKIKYESEMESLKEELDSFRLGGDGGSKSGGADPAEIEKLTKEKTGLEQKVQELATQINQLDESLGETKAELEQSQAETQSAIDQGKAFKQKLVGRMQEKQNDLIQRIMTFVFFQASEHLEVDGKKLKGLVKGVQKAILEDPDGFDDEDDS